MSVLLYSNQHLSLVLLLTITIMKSILILGAGLSASSLIRYLLKNAASENWHLRIVDQDRDLVLKKIGDSPYATALSFNALVSEERMPEIEKADLVISMLPARFHVEVAKDCLKLKKHLITPSYVSSEMKSLHEEAKKEKLIFLNEIGVDPGIDHMSAMKIIHEVQASNGTISSFKSFCGGLIAPDSDNNPWGYKITWNPKNVVLAGQGGLSSFKRNKEFKYIPYHQLFRRIDKINIEGYGDFEGYPNRDSLSYQSVYGLNEIETIYRGTLRRPTYCEAWDVFVQLGMTDHVLPLTHSENLSPRTFLNAFLAYHPTKTVEEKFKDFLGSHRIHLFGHFEFLGFFDAKPMNGPAGATAAELLELIITEKWRLAPQDKDMLVMHHQFEYTKDQQKYRIESSMVSIGEDPVYTAMSNTVGLPVAIASKMILKGMINEYGVLLPVNKAIYQPILEELEALGIVFNDKHYEIQ